MLVDDTSSSGTAIASQTINFCAIQKKCNNIQKLTKVGKEVLRRDSFASFGIIRCCMHVSKTSPNFRFIITLNVDDPFFPLGTINKFTPSQREKRAGPFIVGPVFRFFSCRGDQTSLFI